MRRNLFVSIRILLAFAIALPGFADNKKNNPDEIGNRDVGKGVNFYSLDKEIALGKGLAQEVEKQAKIIDDPVISEYVNRVGQNLVRNSDAKVPFTIKVIDSEDVNAFALPGGFFFVNSGLILKADNEAELAGVMAHEIAHVAARHGTRQATRGELAQLGMIPLMLFSYGWAGYGMYEAASVLVPVAFLKFSRGFEAEADMLGLQYMYKSRLRSDGVRRFLREDRDARKEEAGDDVESLLHAPADGRPHQGRAGGHQDDAEVEAGVRADHFGVQRREEPAGGDAQPAADRRREGSEQTDAAADAGIGTDRRERRHGNGHQGRRRRAAHAEAAALGRIVELRQRSWRFSSSPASSQGREKSANCLTS